MNCAPEEVRWRIIVSDRQVGKTYEIVCFRYQFEMQSYI